MHRLLLVDMSVVKVREHALDLVDSISMQKVMKLGGLTQLYKISVGALRRSRAGGAAWCRCVPEGPHCP